MTVTPEDATPASDGRRSADEPTDGHVEVRPGLRLAVRRSDGDTAPPFVLVHGLASNARLWDGVADRLRRAGHRVLAVDQRGHGQSDIPDDGYDFATVTDDLARLLRVEDLDRPVLVGQSWGGNVVLDAAARWDDKLAGVALVDGGTIDLQHHFPTWEACAEQLAPPVFAGVTYDEIARWIGVQHPDWPAEGVAGTLANFAVADDGTVRARLPRAQHMKILRALWAHRPRELYGRIDAPVLLIPADTGDVAWSADKRRDVAIAAEEIPRANVRWLTGDHDLHAQQPDVVAGLLLDAVAGGFFG